jgi:hypothetical protein
MIIKFKTLFLDSYRVLQVRDRYKVHNYTFFCFAGIIIDICVTMDNNQPIREVRASQNAAAEIVRKRMAEEFDKEWEDFHEKEWDPFIQHYNK